jgi:hypothetical protein
MGAGNGRARKQERRVRRAMKHSCKVCGGSW